MEIKNRQEDNLWIVEPIGRLDSNTSQQLEDDLTQKLADNQKYIILDFQGLDYISSAGLRVILKSTREAQRLDGLIVLCSLKDYVKEVFEVAGIGHHATTGTG